MKIRTDNELILMDLLVVAYILFFNFFPVGAIRIILGFPFLLFFPGYSLISALFPGNEEMNAARRVVIGLGMSVIVVPIIGIILNYTSWGINQESVLYSVSLFVFIVSVAGWIRRRRLAESKRFRIEFTLALPGWSGSKWGKRLSIILAVSFIVVLVMLGYAIFTPKDGESYTEYYILGQESKAADYPLNLVKGQQGSIKVGIINQEHDTVLYKLDILINGVKIGGLDGVWLNHGEKWEGEVQFTPEKVGDNQAVEFLLYKNDATEAYSRPLRLWIDVIE